MKTSWLCFVLLVLFASNCASRKEMGDVSSFGVAAKHTLIPRSDTPQILRDALLRKPPAPDNTPKMPIQRIYVYDTVRIYDTIYLYEPVENTESAEMPTTPKRSTSPKAKKLKKENETLKEENAKLMQHINAIAANAQNVKMNMPMFSVQLAAYKYKLTNVNLTFATLSLNGKQVGEEYYADDPNGFPFKYVVGEFYELEDAIRYCKYINDQGVISGAFVVAYYNNRRIKIRHAVEIIEKLK